ncbi:MAG: hypothetical protein HYS22_09245 [Deltaproteobacteria bacterium]|nr:hypothetical protein [Deltaproteobacteria bacterium]
MMVRLSPPSPWIASLLLAITLTTCGSSSDVTGELVLNDGADSVEGLTVTAKLTGSSTKDNVTAYILSEDPTAPAIDSTLWISIDPGNPIMVETGFNLSPAVGNHIIYAWLKDLQGNISDEITASITVQSPPGGITGAITINSGATYTSTRELSLVLSGLSEGTITGYLVSEDKNAPGVNAGGWVSAFSPSPVLRTPSPTGGEGKNQVPSPLTGEGEGEGAKTSTSGFSKTTITLDTTAPTGTLLIDGGNKLTLESDADVSESVTATDNSGIIAYLFSTDSTPPAVSSSSWVAIGSTGSLTQSQNTTLSSPMKGKKTLYVHLKDKANNIQTLSDEIEVLRILTTGNETGFGQYTSIAVDSSGNPSISLYRGSSGDLGLNSNPNFSQNGNNAAFSYTGIDGIGDVGAGTSIAVDSNNKLHIAYRDTTNSTLKYATNKSGSWVPETIEAGGVSPSIAVDSNGTVHISHQASNKVRYVTGTAGSWSGQEVLSTGNFAAVGASSLVVDTNNKVYVVGSNLPSNNLYYTTNKLGSWSSEEKVSDNAAGASVAVNKTGIVYISFSKSNALTLATNSGSGWNITTIDSTMTVGLDAISTDSTGHIYICYYDATNKDLKYATNLTGSWVTMTLDSTGDIGNYCDIAIDLNDRLHISYYDATNGRAKYATTSD